MRIGESLSRGSAGFTLVEVLTAVAVLGIGLTAAVALAIRALSGIQAAGDRMEAAVFLEGALAEARAAAAAGPVSGKRWNGTLGGLTDGVWEIQAIGTESPHLDQLWARAAWGRTGARKELTITTYAHAAPESED